MDVLLLIGSVTYGLKLISVILIGLSFLSYFRRPREKDWGAIALAHLRQFWRASTVVEGYDSGVVCLSGFANPSASSAKVYLWNPDDNVFWELPSPPATPADSRRRNAAFRLGVGRDPSTGDLKVVRVCSEFPSSLSSYFDRFYHFFIFQPGTQVSVYSLRQNSWRAIEWVPLVDPADPESILKNSMCFRKRSVVVNSCIHWMAAVCWGPPHGNGSGDRIFEIIAFDLATEVFRVMHPPREVSRVMLKDGLAELFGDLALVVIDPKSKDSVDIWVMKNYNDSSSWNKQYSINSTNLNLPEVRVSSIEVANNGQAQIWTSWGVIDYDLNTQTVIHFGSSRSPEWDFRPNKDVSWQVDKEFIVFLLSSVYLLLGLFFKHILPRFLQT